MAQTLAAEPTPFLVIRPSSGWGLIDFKEMLRFRDLLWSLAGRDIKLRYRQTALGAAWVLLQPLLAAGILSFVFGVIAGLKSDGVPYFVFAYAGQVGWMAFSTTLTKSSQSMLGNSHLVSKVYFPRLLLPLSTMVSTLIDFAVAIALMAVLLAIFQINPGWPVLLLPVWVGLLLMLSLGVGLVCGAMMVSYRDVQYILPVLVQLLMYGSPVAYSVMEVARKIPEKYLWIYYLNPLASILEATRWSLLGTAAPRWDYLGYAAVACVVTFLFGALAFRRMERTFADVI